MNRREKEVKARYEKAGWRVLRNGAPDFICLKVDEVGNILETRAIEVKAPGVRLSYEQAVYRQVFEKAGVDYTVEEQP